MFWICQAVSIHLCRLDHQRLGARSRGRQPKLRPSAPHYRTMFPRSGSRAATNLRAGLNTPLPLHPQGTGSNAQIHCAVQPRLRLPPAMTGGKVAQISALRGRGVQSPDVDGDFAQLNVKEKLAAGGTCSAGRHTGVARHRAARFAETVIIGVFRRLPCHPRRRSGLETPPPGLHLFSFRSRSRCSHGGEASARGSHVAVPSGASKKQ